MAEQELILKITAIGAKEISDLQDQLNSLKQSLIDYNKANASTDTAKLRAEIASLRNQIQQYNQEQKRLTQNLTDTRREEDLYIKNLIKRANEQANLLALQEREEAALQKHLGQMEAAAQKEANAQALIYQARRKNIEAAVQQSQALQEREEAALQKHLGQMEAAAQKEANAQALIYQARRKNIEAAVQQSQAQLSGITPANNMTNVMGKMAIAGQNLNFVIRDSPYFFRNFQLGVLAVGNNIDPLIQSFRSAQQEAQKMGVSFGSVIMNFLRGPGGFIVVVSLLNAVIQALVFSMGNSKSKAKEFTGSLNDLLEGANKTKESLQKLNDEFEKMPFVDIGIKSLQMTEVMGKLAAKVEENNRMAEWFYRQWNINIKIPIIGWLADVGLGIARLFYNWNNKEAEEKINQLKTGFISLYDKVLNVSGLIKSGFSADFKKLETGKLKELLRYLSDLQDKLPAKGERNIDIGIGINLKTSFDQLEKLKKEIQETLNSKQNVDNSAKTDSALSQRIKSLDIEQNLAKNLLALDKEKESDYENLLIKQRDVLSSYDLQKFSLDEQLKITSELVSRSNELKSIADKRASAEEKVKREIEKSREEYKKFISGIEKSTGTFVDEAGRLVARSEVADQTKDQTALIRNLRVRQQTEQEMLLKKKETALSVIDAISTYDLITFIMLESNKLQIERNYQEAKKAINDYYNQLQKEAELAKYRELTSAISKLGNSLQSAFSKAGDDFISKLNQALQVTIQIANAIKALNQKNDTTNILGFISSILGIFSLFHEGGIVKAHDGMLAKDEVPIIARKGEMIFNDRQQSNLFNLINNPSQDRGGNGATIIVNHYTTLDGDVIAKKQYKYLPQQLYRLSRERIPV